MMFSLLKVGVKKCGQCFLIRYLVHGFMEKRLSIFQKETTRFSLFLKL